jgi:thiol-disulfide isomerase/thioredoxin
MSQHLQTRRQLIRTALNGLGSSAALACLPTLAAPKAEAKPGAQSALGQAAPAELWAQQFDTPTGQPLPLASFKGKPLLINFWATWCPPCVKEMPELERFFQTFGAKGWQVVGLAIDGPTPVREFLARRDGKFRGVTFPIGLAGMGGTELAALLGNQGGGLPFSVMLDAQGRLIRRKMGATHFKDLSQWARQAR